MMTIKSQFSDMTSSSEVFDFCFVSLINFTYWSTFHLNIITGSGLLTILFYEGLTGNPEIGNTRNTEFCLISGDCSKLEISYLARMSLIKLLRENHQLREGEGNFTTQNSVKTVNSRDFRWSATYSTAK